MQQRTLGEQGLTVSALGYGSMGITSFYGASDTDEGIAAIRAAHDLGVTLFDTAELYGWGEGEKVLVDQDRPSQRRFALPTRPRLVADPRSAHRSHPRQPQPTPGRRKRRRR